ncbi:C6 zinc finger domain-containing protein [Ilyonectria sp. MPI-CAGE-AT-0026]|nr:C6 zinc finger domain-containing protein [Ilyonectria sp. MPI-CAGE-AT-0026]
MGILSSPSLRTTGSSSEFGSLSGRELELMHHYFVNTCSSLALRGDVRQVWRDVIPQEGYNHAFVMHGILAVSALHKSLLTPSRRQEYLAVSAHHHVIGVEGFTLRLRQVNEDNWKPVFSFAALTILYVCLLPARCEHLTLTGPIPSILELFTVIRGMRSFLSPFFKNLDSTSFAPLHHGIWTHPEVDSVDPSFDQACLPKDTSHALRNLKAIFDDQQPEIHRDYFEAIAALEDCATQFARGGMYVDSGMVMLWLYIIPERVLHDIKLRAPFALLLLAYFCVFWGILESRLWYLRGWAKQVLADIDLHLAHHQQLTELMKWPKREVLGINFF